jgi:hypothetical protein
MQDTVLERLIYIRAETNSSLVAGLWKLVPKSKFAEKSETFDHKYYFSESLGCKLTENYDELKNISLFFQRIIKKSKQVRHPTCLETNFILIPNFPRISAKYAPKYQKRIIFYEFKQFWWIWSFMPMSSQSKFSVN